MAARRVRQLLLLALASYVVSSLVRRGRAMRKIPLKQMEYGKFERKRAEQIA